MTIRKHVFFFFLLAGNILAVAQATIENDLNDLVKQVNSRNDEQNPILSPDGNFLYFTRANDSLNVGGTKDKGDIWYSGRGEDGKWTKPKNLGSPINDELKNYLLGFSPDGKIMFLNQEKKNPGGYVINDGIAYSVYQDGAWSLPGRLSVEYMFNKSEHQSGSVSADGRYLVLSLQSYASRGTEDIYVCSYKDGKWTQPVNLGSVINTAKQEMTPYLSPDNKKLYFSSNGHGGRGGRDILVSERLDDGWTNWSKPQSIGPEVNSEGVELGWYIDAKNDLVYFSSTQNSDGYGDIKVVPFSVPIEPKQENSQTLVYDELTVVPVETKKNISVSGAILNEKSNEGITAAINIKSADIDINGNSTPEDGLFKIQLPAGAGKVVVSIKSPGFMGITEEVVLSDVDLTINFKLMPLDVGTTITLNKVYFDRGTSQLLDDSYIELGRVVEMMKENPTVKIELSGHTDNQGNSKLNIQLSQERVDVVKKYLEDHGVEANRIRGKGYGGTRPVASNASEESRKLNRRVDFTILKN